MVKIIYLGRHSACVVHGLGGRFVAGKPKEVTSEQAKELLKNKDFKRYSPKPKKEVKENE